MKAEKGFTLIELLVVVAIIGILAAIAIPQFAAYKVRSFNSRAEADLRNGMTAEEAYYVQNEAYNTCDSTTCTGTLPGLENLSGGVHLAYDVYTSLTGQEYKGAACHEQGDTQWLFDSGGTGLTSAPVAEGACNDGLVTASVGG